MVETLVRKGAHLNEKNKELLTPLHIATDLSHYDLMDTLLRLGAKVNVLDALGQTGKEDLTTNNLAQLADNVIKVFSLIAFLSWPNI